MDDQGFGFQPTTRRETKKFEPPPWEKEAFERSGVESQEETAETGPLEAADLVAAPVPQPASRERISPRKGEAAAELDEARVVEMLAALTAEEPKMSEVYDRVAVVSGIAVGLLGCVLVFWGMAGVVSGRNTGATGYVAGTGLFVFGAFFIGMGVWFVYRTLKQRGVL